MRDEKSGRTPKFKNARDNSERKKETERVSDNDLMRQGCRPYKGTAQLSKQLLALPRVLFPLFRRSESRHPKQYRFSVRVVGFLSVSGIRSFYAYNGAVVNQLKIICIGTYSAEKWECPAFGHWPKCWICCC